MGFFFCIVGIDLDKGIEMLSVPRAGFSKLKASEHGFGAADGLPRWMVGSISSFLGNRGDDEIW